MSPDALKGRWELSRGRAKANPRNIAINECAPAAAGAQGVPATPAGVRIVVSLLSGGSLRSPPSNHFSPRWGGIRYSTKEPNVTGTSNYTRKRAHSRVAVEIRYIIHGP